jgi:hypothetical protein
MASMRRLPAPLSHDAGQRPAERRSSGLALWRPRIVAPGLVRRDERKIVLAEPGLRPEAVRAQVEAGRSALARLAEAQTRLGARVAALHEQAQEAGTERERVAAVMATYRIKTALDEAFRDTLRDVGALMEERGRR